MVSAVPSVGAFASQHYEWRECLLGCPWQLLCDIPSFQEQKRLGEQNAEEGAGLLRYQALRRVYHISFIVLCRIRLILLTTFVWNINDPASIQIGKPVARRAQSQPGPKNLAYFSGLTNSTEEVPGETERLLWQTRSTIITPWWKSHGERASHR